MERLFDTAAAARWMTDHGIRRSPITIKKLRSIGGGPSFRILNGRAYYTESDLISWVDDRLSAPRRSTSEPDQAA
jgi:hypothetical protein